MDIFNILKKKFLFFSLIFIFSNAQLSFAHEAIANLTIQSFDIKENQFKKCLSPLQSCTVLATTANSGCIAGFIFITNNSSVPARNITASSYNPNFLNFVVQNNGCPSTLAPGASCSISFSTTIPATFIINDVMVKGTNTNAAFFNIQAYLCPTSLVASVSNLALSVTGFTEFGVPGTPASGLSRVITISNIGGTDALNVVVTPPTWPAGTTNITTCGPTLPAGGSCTITIIPGNTATSNGITPCSSGNAPIPGVVQVTSDNANTVTTNVLILSYGCIYQGGYIFTLNDTPPVSASISGKVAATANQSASINWSSDSAGSYDGGVSIFGIDETSTPGTPSPNTGQVPGQVGCTGTIDGACNTNNIFVYYQNNAPGAPINLSFYAAGLCKQTIGAFSDWYLPANCELGYSTPTSFPSSGCGSLATPTTQNFQSSLVDFNALNLISGLLWSSTEEVGDPTQTAWFRFFDPINSETQAALKNAPIGVRCARIF
jgi:hypothetical protein